MTFRGLLYGGADPSPPKKVITIGVINCGQFEEEEATELYKKLHPICVS